MAMQNLGHAWRVMRKSPGFSAGVVAILALGIGANAAIFSLINAVLLRPLPYRDSANLVLANAVNHKVRAELGCLTYAHFDFLKEHSGGAFAGFAGFTNETFALSSRGEPVQLQSARVSASFFDVLGVKLALGRGFIAEEDKPGGSLSVILSDHIWKERFGSDPSTIGQTVTLDSKPYTVVGILAPAFRFGLLGSDIDLWTTHVDQLNLMTPQQLQGGVCYLDSVARIKEGVSFAQMQQQLSALNAEYMRRYPKMPDADPTWPLEITPLQQALVTDLGSTFMMLSGAVALVLLIACANVAGLQLTRALGRRREVAIRTAIGATRRRLIGQFLTESMLLSLLGGALGVGLSFGLTQFLTQLLGQKAPELDQAANSLDWHVLAFGLALSLATGLLFGLAPALQFAPSNLSGVLRDEGRGTTGGRRRNLMRNLLIAGQIALSVVLLIAAGLLVRSFIRLQTEAPGFDQRRALTMHIMLPPAKYSTHEQMIAFYDRALEQVKTIPGIEAAAFSSALPVNPARRSPVLVDGQPAVPLPQRPMFMIQTFTPGYLDAMKIPLLRGRFFTNFDRETSRPVVVVNETVAQKYFPGQNPIGKHVAFGSRSAEIIGVIGNVKNLNLSSPPQPEIDLPFSQLPWGGMNLIVRANSDPKMLMQAVRARLAKIDGEQPVTSVRTLEEVLAEARSQPRVMMTLLAIFAAAAFALALIGLYGAISYAVHQRTQEIGIRIALGASYRDVMRMVLGQGASLSLIGIAAGLAASFAVTRVLSSLIYDTSPTDPVTFVLSPVLFLAFAMLASYLPARRATRVDPADALRTE